MNVKFLVIFQMLKSFPDMIRDSIGCNQSYVNLNETFARAEVLKHFFIILIFMHFEYNRLGRTLYL